MDPMKCNGNKREERWIGNLLRLPSVFRQNDCLRYEGRGARRVVVNFRTRYHCGCEYCLN